MKDILSKIYVLLIFTFVLFSCNNRNILHDDQNFQITSNLFKLSDLESIDHLSDIYYYKCKSSDLTIAFLYSKNNYYKNISIDTTLQNSLGTKIHEEIGKKSIIIRTKFENNILIQYSLNYFNRSITKEKMVPKKEIEIRFMDNEHFIKLLIEINSKEYNLYKDLEWANKMISNFEIELKK